MANFSRIRAENQFVFLGTGIVYGINSIKTNYNLGAFGLNYIGIGNYPISQIQNEPQYTDLSLGGLLVNSDQFIQNSGLTPINCFILQNPTNPNTAFSYISGYLNNYTAKYTPNQIPQINSTFKFYNNAGNLPYSSLDPYSSGQLASIVSNQYSTFNGNVSSVNIIQLSMAEYLTNRVTDFTFSIDYNRLPIYNIGSRAPVRTETIFPVSVTCNISFEAADNFSDITLTDFPLNSFKQNIELDVYTINPTGILYSYNFNNITLVSNERQINADGNLIINRKYVGQLFLFSNPVNDIPATDFGFVYNSPDLFLDWGFVNVIATTGLDFGLA